MSSPRESQQRQGEAVGRGARLWLDALHDLRQPLQAAQMLIETARGAKTAEGRRKAAGLLEDTLAAVDLMLMELARLTRLECDAQGRKAAPVDLDRLLAEALIELGEERFQLEPEASLPVAGGVRVPVEADTLKSLLRAVLVWPLTAGPGVVVVVGRGVAGGVVRLRVMAGGEIGAVGGGIAVGPESGLFVEVPHHAHKAGMPTMYPGPALVARLAGMIGGALEYCDSGDARVGFVLLLPLAGNAVSEA